MSLAYPLHWPVRQPRTSAEKRRRKELEAAWKASARRAHPDLGGSAEQFVRVKNAHQAGQKAMGFA